MTAGSAWRTELARGLADAYAESPKVAAVMLGGSTARGQADRYSDLELGVFWSDVPSKAERAAAVERAGADLHLLYEPDGRYIEDLFFVGHDAAGTPKSGLCVEVPGMLIGDIDRIVASLDVEPAVDAVCDEDTMSTLSGIADGIPLYGTEIVRNWGNRVRSYPDALARAVVRRHGMIEFFWRWRMLVDRGGHPGPIHAHLWGVQRNVVQLLLAVNRRYPLGYKFLDSIVERCVVAPADLSRRFDAVSTLPVAEGAHVLSDLVLETYDLVEQHIPGLEPGEVERWRGYFAYERPSWDARPPRL